VPTDKGEKGVEGKEEAIGKALRNVVSNQRPKSRKTSPRRKAVTMGRRGTKDSKLTQKVKWVNRNSAHINSRGNGKEEGLTKKKRAMTPQKKKHPGIPL